jgi:hypothetical protein
MVITYILNNSLSLFHVAPCCVLLAPGIMPQL